MLQYKVHMNLLERFFSSAVAYLPSYALYIGGILLATLITITPQPQESKGRFPILFVPFLLTDSKRSGYIRFRRRSKIEGVLMLDFSNHHESRWPNRSFRKRFLDLQLYVPYTHHHSGILQKDFH